MLYHFQLNIRNISAYSIQSSSDSPKETRSQVESNISGRQITKTLKRLGLKLHPCFTPALNSKVRLTFACFNTVPDIIVHITQDRDKSFT